MQMWKKVCAGLLGCSMAASVSLGAAFAAPEQADAPKNVQAEVPKIPGGVNTGNVVSAPAVQQPAVQPPETQQPVTQPPATTQPPAAWTREQARRLLSLSRQRSPPRHTRRRSPELCSSRPRSYCS